MKKIIGFLVAAIICVGAAFAFNTNDRKPENNKVSLEQEEGNEAEQEKADKPETEVDENKNTDVALDKDTETQDNTVDVDNKNTAANQGTNNQGSGSSNTTNNQSTNGNNDSNNDNVSTVPDKVETVTITINAQKAIDYGIRNEDGFGHLPANGVILSTATVEIKDGDTVYDVLAKVIRDNKIHMEYTGAGSTIYIQGIDNLYEFDCGKYSGWMYEVNGTYPNYGVGAYTLKSGDKITFNYTCDLGKDLGAPIN